MSTEPDTAFEKLVAVLQNSAYTAGATGGHQGREAMVAAVQGILDSWKAQKAEIARLREYEWKYKGLQK